MKTNDGFEKNLDEVLIKLRETLIKKHHDYGAQNILKYKDIGVLIRLNDKIARLENLSGITDGSFQKKTAANESILDTWEDILHMDKFVD
jgi:hypothetical protein